MSSMVEIDARKTTAELAEPDKVRVKVRVSWRDGMCLPDPQGTAEEEAVFAVVTVGDNHAIEKAVTREVDVGDGRTKVTVADLNEYKRLLVKRNLLSWTLDVPVERDASGWMKPESYARVAKVQAPLMVAFLRGLEESMDVTDEEERKIDRQCALLFSRTGRGVVDACEAVSMFCTLGNYWEKFGIDKFKLPLVPYKEYLLLKIMVGKEAESSRMAARPKAHSSTKIAGPGGRVRPSRGVTMPG